MTIDDECVFDAPYMSTIWNGDEVVGEVTSSAMGYRTNKVIALGMLKADLMDPGTALEIEIFGGRYKATVQEDQPMWDPANERLRA
jgi:dimethylglycine dehydrogenase